MDSKEDNMLFIEFDILDAQKFVDFQQLYEDIVKVSNTEKPETVEFWQARVPQYCQVFFNLVPYNHPNYDRRKMDFEAMMDYLQINLEVEYKVCQEIGMGKGRLEFLPLAYPYGGMDRLILFLRMFDCPANKINSGFGLKTVVWNHLLDFSCTKT